MDNKDLWQPKRRIEVQYQKALHEMVDFMQESIADLTDPFEIITKIKGLFKNPFFQRFTEAASLKMVTQLFTGSAKTWREAARESSQGRIIYEALKKELRGPVGGAVAHQIQRNAEIIKSLPLGIASQLTDYISEESFKGRRTTSIAQDILEQLPTVSKNKAKLIARTEVSKTSTALTRARSENLGLAWYRWRTSKDARVRDSHELMDGVLVRWTDPPQPERLNGEKNSPPPYHAGSIYNCRCYPEVIVTLDAISWPAKVYRNGSITTMTRTKFEQAFGRG